MSDNEQEDELRSVLINLAFTPDEQESHRAVLFNEVLDRFLAHHTKEAVERPTDLLRSALAIAKREEAEGCNKTNWAAFRKQLEAYFSELRAAIEEVGGGKK